MPLFDLGAGVAASRRTSLAVDEAFRRCEETLRSFRKQGFDVDITERTEASRLLASITDTKGTDVVAEAVVFEDPDGGAAIDIRLRGELFVGGLQGRWASRDDVGRRAKAQLDELLARKLGSPSSRDRAAASGTNGGARRVRPITTAPTRVAEGPRRDVPPLAARAAALAFCAPAPLDVDVFASAQLDLLCEVARAHDVELSRDSAESLRAALGGDRATQAELVQQRAPNADAIEAGFAAQALTVALGEAAEAFFADGRDARDIDGQRNAILSAHFEAGFERVFSEEKARGGEGRPDSSLRQRLGELADAFDAELVTDDEVLAVAERLFAGG